VRRCVLCLRACVCAASGRRSLEGWSIGQRNLLDFLSYLAVSVAVNGSAIQEQQRSAGRPCVAGSQLSCTHTPSQLLLLLPLSSSVPCWGSCQMKHPDAIVGYIEHTSRRHDRRLHRALYTSSFLTRPCAYDAVGRRRPSRRFAVFSEELIECKPRQYQHISEMVLCIRYHTQTSQPATS
jgi:hypothetical protein